MIAIIELLLDNIFVTMHHCVVQWILNAIHIMLLRFSLHSNTVYSIIVAGECGVALHFQLNLMQTPVLELHYVTSIFLYLVLFADNSISFLYYFSGKTKQLVKTSTLLKKMYETGILRFKAI